MSIILHGRTRNLTYKNIERLYTGNDRVAFDYTKDKVKFRITSSLPYTIIEILEKSDG